MSTASKTTAPNYYQDLGFLRSWVARRRIAISIACFTALIVFNLAILRRHPSNPLAVWQWQSGIGLSLILMGVGIRTWSAGTLIKVRELITAGPYALSRNPLYVGSFLMMYGFALIMNDWLSIAFIAGPMSMLYYFQVLNEEKYLAALHPEQWASYIKRTRRFVPLKFNSNWHSGWALAQWLHHREYRAIFGALVGVVGLILLYEFGR